MTVKEIVSETIAGCDKCLNDPPARISILQLDPDGFIVTINVWVTAHGFLDTKMELQERLLTGIKAGGIKLPGMS